MRRYRKPHRIKKRKSIFGNRFFWLGILFSIFLFSIFYFLFFSQIFQVKKIIITGEKKVLVKDLELLVENELENKILFFKTKSIFLVNLKKIKEKILNSFPQIAEVEIKKRFPDALNIIVIERFGLASFCQKDQCFLLDGEGIIFEIISENLPEMPKIRRKDGEENWKLGETVVEKEKLSKILETESKLKDELKILSEEILVVSDERFEVKTSEGWQIYFNFKEDLDWQLTKLGAVLEEEIPQERREDLEYIDLRFGNFAPYKYRH